ncbi:hypothetical protein PO883_10540 [Massilia sp. DJPM01]|nr:hypothetical protein [Massilia sp. DJPM01]MDM5177628.1 hypothetical protein [Massilia sp. DJPM01]
MRRLINVPAPDKLNLGPMLTRRVKRDAIEQACALFAKQRDGVPKVAITP